jgi:hypothetical protein
MCTSVSSSEKVCCGPMNVVGIVPVRLLLLAKSILVVDPRWFSEGKSGPSCSFARSGQGFLDTVWSGKARVGKVLCLG